MARILSGGRRDAKLGTTPSGKAVWLEKHPSEYKHWSPSDHLYAAVLHEANRTRGGEIARLHRSLAQGAAKLTSHATKKMAPSAKAVDFFRKHAGYAVRPGESKNKAKTRGAQALARAEAEAEARGWTVEWEHDPEEWQGDVERPFEVLTAVLRDANGNVLTSLGGNGMTGNRKTDADFRRVIEAELADEALR